MLNSLKDDLLKQDLTIQTLQRLETGRGNNG